MTLQFHPIGAGTDFTALPENYFPAALPYLNRHTQLPPLALLVPELPPKADATHHRPPEPQEIPPKTLADPSAMLAQMTPGQEGFLLPLSVALPPAAQGISCDREEATVTVLIDTGIAFWNPAFRKPDGGNRIKAITFLGSGTAHPALKQEDFAPYYALADAPGGARRVVAALAEAYPGSLYDGYFQPDQFSHGTAMADLLSRSTQTEPDPAAIYAIELPAQAVLDRSGASLQAMLLSAIATAIQGVRDSKVSQLNIVLPFACLGGPHNRNHPGLDFLHQALERHAPGCAVEIFVPVGNHRQDRQHARFDDLSPQAQQGITWRLHHGDHSANSLDLTFQSANPPRLRLTAPDGSQAEHLLSPGSCATLTKGGQVVGAALLRSFDQDQHRLRLSLCAPASKTAGKSPALPRCDAGDWRVELCAADAAVQDIALWILRDDSNVHLHGADPVRASEFVDPAYRTRTADNGFTMLDQELSMIKHSGTTSVLCGEGRLGLTAVKALHRPCAGAALQDSWYSGMPLPGQPEPLGQWVDTGWEAPGLRLLGNGSARRFRVSGTSFACALAARADRNATQQRRRSV